MTTIETLHWHSAASGPDADLTVLMWVQYADGECDWAAGWWDGDAWRYCDIGNLVSLAGGTVLHWAEPAGPCSEVAAKAGLSSSAAGNVKQPEPVAWYWVEDSWGANEWHWMTDSPESQGCDPRDWTPVYLAPKAQQPLTEEFIDALRRKYGTSRQDGFLAAVREVEEAHGIGKP